MHLLRQRSARRARWTALLAVAVYGCAGAGPPISDPGNEFDQIQTTIFNQHCLDAGCHNSQSQAGGMDLSPGASYGSLVNVLPANPVARANGLLRVQPSDPSNSFLLVKLQGPAPGEGTRMPQSMAPLSPTDIATIQAWIAAGAPPGSGGVPSATATETVTETPAATETPTITPTPTNTGTPTPSVTGTAPPTLTASLTPTPSPSPSPTATISAPTLAQIQSQIFTATCVDDFCHNSIDQAGNLVLTDTTQSYASLVGVPPDNSTARNAGLLRVDPGHPENSFILVKLAGPTNPRMGSRMPLGKLPLSAAEQQMIADWITAGAQP